MDERDKALVVARIEILRHRQAVRSSAVHGAKTAIDDELVAAYAARSLPLAPSVYESQSPFSVQTLRRWATDLRKHGIDGLRDGRDGNHLRGKNAITSDPGVEGLLLGILRERPTLKATHLAQLMEVECLKRELPTPSHAAVGRYLRGWKENNRELFEQLRNPDAYRSKYLRSLGSSSEQIRCRLQQVQLDDSPADLIFRGRRRANLAFAIDVKTRRGMIVVSDTPNTETVKLLLRRVILEWGVPEEILTDNGPNYTSKEMAIVCHQLAIAIRFAMKFSPEMKGIVERFIRTLQHSTLIEGLSSYAGNDVATRQELRARRSFADRLAEPREIELDMTLEQFQESLDHWCTNYNNTVHSSLGESPLSCWASDKNPIRSVTNARSLDELLARPAGRGRYTIQKNGVRIQGATYICPELGAYDVGTEVRPLIDPKDLGKVVLYRTSDGAFIGVAEDPARTGIDRAEVAAHAKAIQRRRIGEHRAALRSLHREARVDIDEVILDMNRTKALELAKVVPLDAQRIPHDTPALRAGALAAKAKRSPGQELSGPSSRKVRDAVRQGKKALEAPADVLPHFTDDVQRHEHWKRLNARVERGETLPEPLADFYQAWQQTKQFALFNEMETDAAPRTGRQRSAQ